MKPEEAKHVMRIYLKGKRSPLKFAGLKSGAIIGLKSLIGASPFIFRLIIAFYSFLLMAKLHYISHNVTLMRDDNAWKIGAASQ